MSKDLIGRWNLSEAYRGDKKTQTLSGGYFSFTDTTLVTNIFGDSLVARYSLIKDEIVQHIPNEIRYRVIMNPDQSLALTTVINGLSFKMILRR